MKLQIIIVFLINFSKLQILEINDLSVSDKELFERFKQKYHKKYQTESELQYRFQIFEKNLRILKSEPDFTDSDGMVLLGSSNEPEKSYTLGINQFVDMTDEEFEQSYLLPNNLLYKILPADGITPVFNLLFKNQDSNNHDQSLLKNLFGGFTKIFGRKLQNFQLPSNIKRSLDWEKLGKVSPIKNQKRCNSCYAFAATGAIESMFSIKYDSEFISLSTQEILDCDSVNKGCKGGQPSLVFDYVQKNGLSLEKDYEYVAKDQTCKLNGRRLQYYYGGQSNSYYQPQYQQNQQYNGVQNYQQNQYNYNNGYRQPYYGQQNNFQNQYGYNSQYQNQYYKPYQQNYHNQNNNQYSNSQISKNQNTVVNESQQNNNVVNNNIIDQKNQNKEEDQNQQLREELLQKQKVELEQLKNQYQIKRTQDRKFIDSEIQQILELIQTKRSVIETKKMQIEKIKQKKQKKQLLEFVADELIQFDQKFIEESQQSIDKLEQEIKKLQEDLDLKITQIEQEQIKIYESEKQKLLQKQKEQLENLQNEIQQKNEEQNKQEVPKFERFNFLRTYKSIPQNIVALLQALQDGPVVVAHHVSSQLKFYSKGVFSGDGCEGKPVNHASLIIGYDLDDENPYFRLKNAWGTKWGQEGYYKIAIGEIGYDKKGICSIAGTPFNVQPVLK